MPPSLVARAAPPIFVVVWSTGFIVARLVAGHIGPFTFLAVRFALAAAALAMLSWLARSAWPRSSRQWRDVAIAGILIQAVYLGGIFWAVARGLPSGVAALIAGAQPLLTGLLARPLLGERVGGRRWGGIALGFLGVLLVIEPRLQPGDAIPPAAFLAALTGTLAITFGTIWQKRIGATLDVLPGTAIQYAAATPVAAAAAFLDGEATFVPSASLWLGLVWAVFGLSIGAVGLFFWMIRQGAVVGVAALLFLVPPVTAAMGFWLFGEALQPIQLAGMALAAIGVAVANRG